MLEDSSATLDVVRNEITDMNTRPNLIMPVRGIIPISKIKISEPNPLYGVTNAKALENYFKATSTVTEEVKVTLPMMHLYELNHIDNIWEYIKQFTGAYVRHTRYVGERQFFVSSKVWNRAQRPNYTNKGSKTSCQHMQRANGCLIWPVTLKMWDVTKILHLEGTRIVVRVPPKVPRETNVLVETTGLIYQSNIENTWRRPNNQDSPKRPLNCFICKGPHLARECPNKIALYAF